MFISLLDIFIPSIMTFHFLSPFYWLYVLLFCWYLLYIMYIDPFLYVLQNISIPILLFSMPPHTHRHTQEIRLTKSYFDGMNNRGLSPYISRILGI